MSSNTTLSKQLVIWLVLILFFFCFVPAKANGGEANIPGGPSSKNLDLFQANNKAGGANFVEVAQFIAADGEPFERFGQTIAVDGDTLVIGAIYDNDNGVKSGAVYIFERNAGGTNQWGLVKKITGNDTSAGDEFGAYFDIHGDTLVVGAKDDDVNGSDSGSAYVFERNAGGTNNWGQVKKLISSDNSFGDNFGWHARISGDTIVVGSYNNDDACPGDFTCNSGAIYIFERNAGGPENWGEVKKLTASDMARDNYFSWGLDIDGDAIVVGAIGNDVNGYRSGAAYVFMRDLGGLENWGQVTKLVPSDGMIGDEFGNSIAIFQNTIVVGARYSDVAGIDSGAAYVFQKDPRNPGIWKEIKKLIASDAAVGDSFGDRGIAMSSDWIVIGAPLSDHNGSDSGSVYIFERKLGGNNNWGQLVQLGASDTSAGDQFGFYVDVSGKQVFVGARFHDGAAGIDQGAAYIFEKKGR